MAVIDTIILESDNAIIPVQLRQTSGGAGTKDYTKLVNKPQINGVTLEGNLSTSDLGMIDDANYVHTDNNFEDWHKSRVESVEQGAQRNVRINWNDTEGMTSILNKPTNLVQDANYVHTDNNLTNARLAVINGISDIVDVSDTQPSSQYNEIWIPATVGEGTQVPTYTEFQALEASLQGDEEDIDQLKSAINHYNVNGSDLTAFTRPYIINTSSKWGVESARHLLIPIDGITTVKLTANSSYATIYAFLTDDTLVSGATPSFVSGTGRTSLTKNTFATVTVPSGAKFLYVSKETSGNNYLPVTLLLDGADFYKSTVGLYGDLREELVNVYATLADMKADVSLAVGMTAKTLGYYSIGDGGGAYYKIANSRPANYHPALNNGLYAILVIENNEVNGAALGAIGSNDTITKIRYAIQCAKDNDANLRFPTDMTISGSIVIDKDLSGKIISFDGAITYSGTVAAITVSNAKHVTLLGNRIEATSTGAVGLLYEQSTESNERKTIQNVNATFNYIEAYVGVRVNAKTYGVLECEIAVDRIKAYTYGLHCQCLQEDASSTSFIGQMRFTIQHILSQTTAAIRIVAPVNDTNNTQGTCTGIYINDVSLESSYAGIMLRGDCKMVHIKNIRCFEMNADENISYIINASGDLRYNEFSFTSPVRADLLTLASTYSCVSKPILVIGGIESPTRYKFADYAVAGSQGKIYGGANPPLVFENGADFTFANDSSSYRMYTQFINSSAAEITCDLAGYFSPFGVSEIDVRQNKTDGSVFTIKVGNTTVFDGSSVSDSGVTDYKISALYDSTNGTTTYVVRKL